MSGTPKSIATATVRVMGVNLILHNLDNGERIIEADGLHELLSEMAAGVPLNEEEAAKLAKALRP